MTLVINSSLFKSFSRLFCIVFSVFLLGCAAQDAKRTQEEFSAMMFLSSANADSMLEKGKSEEALKLLSDLAAKNPTRKEPWSKLAKVYFDSENYAQAIVAAEEVLQRDDTDRQAKSIRVVAGLRVAAQSLRDLKGDVELKGDAKSDAVGLAKVMRETLGEEVLVPLLEDGKKKASQPVRRRAQPVSPKPQSTESTGGGNPFSTLK